MLLDIHRLLVRCYLLELRRCVSVPAVSAVRCVCAACVGTDNRGRGAARAGGAPRTLPRGTPSMSGSTTSSSAPSSQRDGLIFLACELDAGRRSVRVFLRISRFWCLKTRKNFRPRRGGQSSRSRNRSRLHVGYASSRPKGEIDALPLDFRIRLGSKKSAIGLFLYARASA